MKKLIAKVLLLLLIAGAALPVFDTFFIGSQYSLEYTASILDKMDRARQIEQPKIILAGHSAFAFGICSEMIEEELGMPVVNLGLHGGLRNPFHERMAKACVQPGDIVVLGHSEFNSGVKPDYSLMWTTIDCHYELLQFCGIEDVGGLLAAYPTYFRNAWARMRSGIGSRARENIPYSRYAFNAYGDVVYKPQECQMDASDFFSKTEVGLPEIDNTCTDRINRLNEYITQRGASLVIAGYPIAFGQYSQFSESDLICFQSTLDEAVSCDIISDYRDYLFPYSMFYDTKLHLTQEGAQIRTQQLIHDLKQWQIAKQPS